MRKGSMIQEIVREQRAHRRARSPSGCVSRARLTPWLARKPVRGIQVGMLTGRLVWGARHPNIVFMQVLD